MALLKVIEEQCSFEFTGRVNVLLKKNSQFLGHILLLDGKSVYCRFNNMEGERALYRIIIKDVLGDEEVKYVVEPEIVEESSVIFSLDMNTLRKNSELALKKYQKGIKFRPPNELRLLVKTKILDKNIRLSPQEFDVLNVLSDYNKVEDLYNMSELFEDEVTNALVSLRKKELLKVIGLKEKL